MIDVLNNTTGKHSSASDSSGEGAEDGPVTSPLTLRSSAHQAVLADSPPSSSGDGLVQSWSAEWQPQVMDEEEADGEEDVEGEEERRRAARRCERLMEVRSLFLVMYHTVVPSSPVAPILSTAPVCPHFTQAKQVAATLPALFSPPLVTDPIDHRAQSSSPLESMRSFSGAGEGGGSGAGTGRMNLLGWMPF